MKTLRHIPGCDQFCAVLALTDAAVVLRRQWVSTGFGERRTVNELYVVPLSKLPCKDALRVSTFAYQSKHVPNPIIFLDDRTLFVFNGDAMSDPLRGSNWLTTCRAQDPEFVRNGLGGNEIKSLAGYYIIHGEDKGYNANGSGKEVALWLRKSPNGRIYTATLTVLATSTQCSSIIPSTDPIPEIDSSSSASVTPIWVVEVRDPEQLGIRVVRSNSGEKEMIFHCGELYEATSANSFLSLERRAAANLWDELSDVQKSLLNPKEAYNFDKLIRICLEI